MPFFPQPTYLTPEPTLFHLLSALDPSHAHAPGQKAKAPSHPARRPAPQTYTPRFDVTETASAYELYGDVPGLTHDALEIEFGDAQTIVIAGRVGRTPVVDGEGDVKGVGAGEDGESEGAADSGEEKSRRVTVEDDYDEADTPLVTPASTATIPAAAPASPGAEEKEAPVAEKVREQPRYWVAERQVGEFKRSFSFEQRVEADFVTAALRNGVLHVVVPKSVKRTKVVVKVD